jgi:hypothetical protein
MNAREHIDSSLLEKMDSSTEENGLFLNELPIGSKLTVTTRNNIYDIEIREGEVADKDWLNSEVWIKGHHIYCPDWTRVNFHGSTFGGSVLKLFWVGVDMHMEWFSDPAYGDITTSAVESIIRR